MGVPCSLLTPELPWAWRWGQSPMLRPVPYLCTLSSILPLRGWPLELRMEFEGAGTGSGEWGTTSLPFFKYRL